MFYLPIFRQERSLMPQSAAWTPTRGRTKAEVKKAKDNLGQLLTCHISEGKKNGHLMMAKKKGRRSGSFLFTVIVLGSRSEGEGEEPLGLY